MSEVGVISEGWGVKTLGEILQSVKLGGNYPNSEKETNYPLIKMGNINRGFIDLSKIEFITTGHIPSENDKLQYGDILFNTRNTLELVGKVSIWKNELPLAYYNSNLMRLEFKKSEVSSNFFMNYIFNTKQSLSQLKGFGTGTTSVAAIYTRDLLKLEVPLPPLPEQQAIASALGDVDALITALEQLITKKRNIKQGSMQQLLTGKKRLPGFNGEWEVKKLEELCSFTQGVQIPQSEQIKFQKEGYIRYLYIRDFFSEDFEWYVKNTFPDKIMNEKDIMMVNTGNTAGMVYSGAKGVLSNNAFRIKFEEKKIFRDFLFLFLTNPSTQLWIKSFFNSAGQPHVGHKNIAQVKILLPPFPEQQAITQILGDMDTEIESLEQKRDKYKAIKQGMMQELLTGKTRLI